MQDTKALMVQDTKALMVQDTKALMVQDIKTGTMKGLKTAVGPNVALHAPPSVRTVQLHSRPKPLQREQDRCGEQPMRLVTWRTACRPHTTLPVDRALSSQQLRGSLSIRAAHAAVAGGGWGGGGSEGPAERLETTVTALISIAPCLTDDSEPTALYNNKTNIIIH